MDRFDTKSKTISVLDVESDDDDDPLIIRRDIPLYYDEEGMLTPVTVSKIFSKRKCIRGFRRMRATFLKKRRACFENVETYKDVVRKYVRRINKKLTANLAYLVEHLRIDNALLMHSYEKGERMGADLHFDAEEHRKLDVPEWLTPEKADELQNEI